MLRRAYPDVFLLREATIQGWNFRSFLSDDIFQIKYSAMDICDA
jgi:hypothetical protein